MRWDLAGFGEHPVPGDGARVAACAEHLGAMTAAIRAQLQRLAAVNSEEIWVSEAAEAFNEVVEDLPVTLELVATRYERTATALDAFHPVLGRTHDQAEYWIQQAALAQDEIDRAEAGVAAMGDWEDAARRIADDQNAANPDQPPLTPEAWSGEDYHATLQSARGQLATATDHVRTAVASFTTAAETAGEAIRDAVDDDLKNDSGLFASVRRGAQWLVDNIPLAEIAAVLEIIAGITGVLALALGWVPILGQVLGAIALVTAVGALLCDVVLAVAGEGSWWDVAIGAVGIATLGLGRAVGAARNAHRAAGARSAINAPGGMRTIFLTSERTGRRYSGAAARSRLNSELAPHVARRPRSGFVPSGHTYGQAFRPLRNVLDDVAAVRVGKDPELVRFGLGRGPGFTSNARVNLHEYTQTFTGAYGRQAQVLHFAHTTSRVTGLPASLAPGDGPLSPVGSGISGGLDDLARESHREAAADLGATVPPSPVRP